MKPGKPLKRGKPMPRGNGPHRTQALPRGEGGLPYQSPRRRREAPLRRALVEALLAEYPACQRCDSARSVDVHELRKRARDPHAWLDEDLVVALCRVCHQWTEDEPAQAEEDGWLLPSQR